MSVGQALAHASDQAFVLLLPTDMYIGAGVAVVVLTLVFMLVVPDPAKERLWQPLALPQVVRPIPPLKGVILFASWVAFVLMVALIWLGFSGARDPLSNPLPLAVWTLFWVLLLSVQGLIGPIWSLVSPWRGPAGCLKAWLGPPLGRCPGWLGCWPAVVLFLLFGCFLLADPAPSDPERLATVLLFYVAALIVVLALFGREDLHRIDPISAVLALFRMNAFLGVRPDGRGACGLPGWQIAAHPPPNWSQAVFALVLLGMGSFDGLNETFWWLTVLKVNPLEFPGRSAIVQETVLGLLAFVALVIAIYSVTLLCGLLTIRRVIDFPAAFRGCAFAVLPIALGYHIGHYLPGFLVEIQYVVQALSDPLGRGSDLLGLGQYYVSTGFFNRQESVRVIWLSQAAAVVIGHVVSILLVHSAAVGILQNRRQAILFHLPMAVFMIAYTFFGLWLLAAPRGA